MLVDVIKEYGGVEVSALDVYTDMFSLGEGMIQKKNEESGEYKANPLGYWKNDKTEHGHFRIMFEDTFEETLKELQEADFGLLNGISYFGRKRDQNHASKMYAMIFDLDDVTDKSLVNFFSGAFSKDYDIYPLPNYVVLSGSNVHLYYLFDEPIPLYPNIKIQLKSLKYALTERMWNPYTSESEKCQKQGIFQPFRVIGGKTKEGSSEPRVRAFHFNQHPFSLTQLCRYVPEAYKVDESKLFKESKYSMEQAKEKFPEWYEKVIVNKDRTPQKWNIQEKVHGDNPRALYDWWLRLLKEGVTFHHRYFGIMCLVIYGVKVDVSYEQVKKDAYELIPFMNEINPQESFTEQDVESALECYDDRYCTFPIKDISAISGIEIPKNKRNYRKREVHLERARVVQMIDYPNKEWINKDGAPTKEQVVKEWQISHPDGSKAECHRETKLSRVTINKWWLEKAEVIMKNEKRASNPDYVVNLPDGSEVVIQYEDRADLERQHQRLLKYAEVLRKRGGANGNNQGNS